MSVNKVTIMGNLGSDPEIRVMPNGDYTATLSIATSRHWKDQTTGENKELVEWHRIVLYRRLAEVARDYLKKGSKAYIEGYLRTQKWTDNNGIDRWTTNIIGEEMQLLDNKPKVQSEQHEASATPAKQGQKNKSKPKSESQEPPIDDFNGEIPS